MYSLQDVNEVVQLHFTSQAQPPNSITFYTNLEQDRLTVDITTRGILLNWTQSTISAFLGFSGGGGEGGRGGEGTVPLNGEFTEFGTSQAERAVDGEQDPPILARSLVRHARWTGEQVVRVATGNQHTIAQTYNNVNRLTRVWGFGSNAQGQLGCRFNAYSADARNGAPCLVRSVGTFDASMVQAIFAGGAHSALLDSAGRVFLFGSDSHGQLGAGVSFDHSATYLPRLLNSIGAPVKFSSVMLGLQHTMVLGVMTNSSLGSWSEGTKAWAFGSNKYGQLGKKGSQQAIFTNPMPQQVTVAAPAGVSHSASFEGGCAGNDHSMLLDSDKRLWATGYNRFGQAGVMRQDDANLLQIHELLPVGTLLNTQLEIAGALEPFASQRVALFACGADHNLVLTADGKLWSFGINEYGQLMRQDNLGLANANQLSVVSTAILSGSGVNPQHVMGIWAAGSNSIIQTARGLCMPGHFSADGLQPCSTCSAGAFASEYGSMQCTLCLRGYFSPAVSTQCHPCAQGSFTNGVGQGLCVECPTSRSYTTREASISLDNCTTACTTGTAGPLGSAPCTACKSGSYSPSPAFSHCVLCDLGSWQDHNTSSTCNTCPSGQSTANTSARKQLNCREICSVGYFGSSGLAESEVANGTEIRRCKPCGLGYFSRLNRSHVCTPCDFHSYAMTTGQSACILCPAGKGTEQRGASNQTQCISFCLPGTFSSTSLVSCSPCDAGFYAPEKGLKQCLNCSAGNYSRAGSSTCSVCQPGNFSLQGSPQCHGCPPGSYQDSIGQSACITCGRGSYSDSLASRSCTECQAGLDTQTVGAANASACARLCDRGSYSIDGLVDPGPCSNCTAGTASDVDGLTAWPTACLNCTAGHYSKIGAASCPQCSRGFFSSDAASSSCLPCTPGSSSILGALSCSACNAGSFASTPGSARCDLCASGSYQPQPGASSCILCVQGSYSVSPGAQYPCMECIAGKFSNAGSSNCSDCQAGTFSSSNSSSCTPCQPGDYSDQSKSVECFPCDAGTFSSVEGATLCQLCAAGFSAPPASTRCTECAQSTWSDVSLSTCESCPAGYNTTSTQSMSLVECLQICGPGQFGVVGGLSNSRLDSCLSCDSGKISRGFYSTSCIVCLEGTFSVKGSASCEICVAGTYSDPGSSNCTACLPGEYASSQGSATCLQCQAGTFMGTKGATACTPCGFGRYSLPHRMFCEECPPLTSTATETSTNATDCLSFCGPGTYGVDNGVTSVVEPCRPCSAGTYNNFSKQTSCFPCASGSFSNWTGALRCNECPLDTWQNESGSAACLACPSIESFCDSNQTCSSHIAMAYITRTIVVGASAELSCRVYSKSECLNSPRLLGAYPVYGAGENAYGQVFEQELVTENWARQMATCDMFGHEEVSRIYAAGDHSMVQTAEWTPEHNSRFRTSLWSFGLNAHGQLANRNHIATFARNPTPILIPRFLFPSMPHGNYIAESLGNHRFYYLLWDAVSETRIPFNVSIADGIYDPVQLAAAVSAKVQSEHAHPADIFQAAHSSVTQGITFEVARPGFQADFRFTMPNCSACNSTTKSCQFRCVVAAGASFFDLRQCMSSCSQRDTTMPVDLDIGENFGFGAGSKFPPYGTVNEVSAQASNNVFRYRYWCGTLPACDGNYSTFSLTFEPGLYTTVELFAQMRTFSRDNGHGEFAFSVVLSDDHVVLFILASGFQVDFTGSDSVGRFLGFDHKLYPSTPTVSGEYSAVAEGARGNLNPENFKPVQVLTNVSGQDSQDFTLGGKHSLVRTADLHGRTRLWAFGLNSHGQLGSPWNAGTSVPNTTPHLISQFDELNGGLKAVRFEAGERHTMVETSDRQLWVFGSNRYGQLGLSTNSGTDIPNWQPLLWNYAGRDLINASDVLVSDWRLGAHHSMVQLMDGQSGKTMVFSFGSNEFGQLARPEQAGLCYSQAMIVACRSIWDDTFDRLSIVPVANPHPLPLASSSPAASLDIVEIRAGGYHSIVKTRDGRLWCAGSNAFGQCGSDNDISLNSDSFEYPAFENVQHFLVPVGSQYKYPVDARKPIVVAPDLICCAPRSPLALGLQTPVVGCACPSGSWRFDSACVACPFGGAHIKDFITANAHTLVLSADNVWWSFGLNSGGQLLRNNENLGLANANPEPEIVSQFVFGDSNQPFLDIESGSTADHSLVQTYRDFCTPGNYSIDRRSPCERCQGGSFTASKGARTQFLYSFDQSVEHPHSVRYDIEYRLHPVNLNCQTCGAGNFSHTNSSSCSTCPVGTYSFSGASTCHKCSRGTYSNTHTTPNCTLCAKGKSSTSGSTVCFACGLGQHAPVNGSERCLDCALGKYTALNGTSECLPCGIYSYQNVRGSSTCESCPSHRPTTGRSGATSRDECQMLCPAGMSGDVLGESTASMRNCRPCPPGFYGFREETQGPGATVCRSFFLPVWCSVLQCAVV